jgi:hypothetical protein
MSPVGLIRQTRQPTSPVCDRPGRARDLSRRRCGGGESGDRGFRLSGAAAAARKGPAASQIPGSAPGCRSPRTSKWLKSSLDRVSKPVQGVAGSDPPHGLGARCRRRRGPLCRGPAPESTGSHQKVDATRDPSLDNISPRLAPPLLVGLVIVAELTHDQLPRPARIRHAVVVDDSQDNVSPSGRTLQVWQRGPVPTSSAPITPQPRGNGEAVRSRAGITALRNVGRPPAWAGRAPVVGCRAVRPRSGR